MLSFAELDGRIARGASLVLRQSQDSARTQIIDTRKSYIDMHFHS